MIEKKVDANGLPIMGATPGLSTRYVGLTGSQILIKMLAEYGVTDAFGYPGGAILPTFDTLYDAKINFVLVRHEQGAGQRAMQAAIRGERSHHNPPTCSTWKCPPLPGRSFGLPSKVESGDC